MIKKRGEIDSMVLQLIFVMLVFAGLLIAVSERVNARDIKTQVLEKELALLIDSAEAGFSFEVLAVNKNGLIDDMKVEDGRIFVKIDGLGYGKGTAFFSRHDVGVSKDKDKFFVRVFDE